MPSHGSVAYYEVAAQVIPLVFLAIVVEYRAFRFEPGERPSWLTALFVVFFALVFAMAEAGALAAVKSGRPSGVTEFLVDWVLGFGFVMIVVVPLQPYADDLFDRWPLARRLKIRLSRKEGQILPPDQPNEEEHDPPTEKR
jgi:hypothetical protein